MLGGHETPALEPEVVDLFMAQVVLGILGGDQILLDLFSSHCVCPGGGKFAFGGEFPPRTKDIVIARRVHY